MNANELLAYNQGYNAGLKAGIDLNTEPMLRQQQAEIDRLIALCISYIDDEWLGTSSYQEKIDEVNNERK